MDHTRSIPTNYGKAVLPNILLSVYLTASSAAAHELWLDPQSSILGLGQSLSIDMRFGQDLVGQALPYLDSVVSEMKHWPSDAASELKARLGDRPAMQDVALDEPGLHRFTLETNSAFIVFDAFAEFTEYLEYEGLKDIAAMHVDRALAQVDIAEAYIRNARTLVQVGPLAPDIWTRQPDCHLN